jgi:peptide/nickel transport system ATP-binding protein
MSLENGKTGRLKAVLEVGNLSVSYETRKGEVPAVHDVSFNAQRGETVGLVGESGCGKSTVAFSIVDFLGTNGRIKGGCIRFQGTNLIGLSPDKLRQLRGDRMTMVYQDPMQALNPSLRISEQLTEALIVHQQMTMKQALRQSTEMLKRVHMPDPANVMNRYPHQISGGQQQRVVIAMALLNNPELLILDEPTTALDVTVEATVLDLINELKKAFDTTILYITHNLGVVARICDYLSVMYAGEMVEQGKTIDVFSCPLHPYTQGLLRCVPRLGSSKATAVLYPIRGRVPHPAEKPDNACIYAPRCDYATDKCRLERPQLRKIKERQFVRCFHAEKIDQQVGYTPIVSAPKKTKLPDKKESSKEYVLKVNKVKKYYAQESQSVLDLVRLAKREHIKAVDGITFKVHDRSTFGIVGESGCGKTTLLKAIIGLEKIDNGKAQFLGLDLESRIEKRSSGLIKEMQMVFQNPDSTLNPFYSVGNQIARPLKRFKIVPNNEIRDRVIELLEAVRLGKGYYDRLPRQLSGGEKQRVGIARALASRPRMVICDEPVSALDVSVQASVLNLMMELQNAFGTTLIFIAHDISVVRFISDYVAVMYLGQIVEIGPAEAIYAPPYHPYTEALLSAVPIPDPTVKQRRIRLEGTVPSALNPPSGCRFHTRCPRRTMLSDRGKICEVEEPPWREPRQEHRIACHIPLEELNRIEQIIHLSTETVTCNDSFIQI